MVMTLDEYTRKRGNLKLILDEFQRRAIRYPPLCHERFLSPLDIKYDGWRAFAASRPNKSTSKWEYWHGPRDGTWFGRFFGRQEGLRAFRRLCYSLSMIFPDWHSPLTDWMEVVHKIAEIYPSPLLGVSHHIWGWPKDISEDNDFTADEMGERFLRASAFRNEPDSAGVEYPQYPAQRILNFNAFTSSVAAIQIIMEPNLVIPEGQSHDELPIVLLPPQPEPQSITVPGEDQPMLGEMTPFGFHQTGDIWWLSFTGDGKEEMATFKHRKGFLHYQRLMMLPKSTIACTDLDPKTDTAQMAAGSAMDITDFLEEGESLEDFANLGAISEKGVDELGKALLHEFIEKKNQLKLQLALEGDKSVKKELEGKLKRLTKMINVMRQKVSFNDKELQAFQRVKKAMRDCREALRKNGMPMLAKHLSKSVQRIGWAFRYDPKPEVNWEF